jgi:hypothetical protein
LWVGDGLGLHRPESRLTLANGVCLQVTAAGEATEKKKEETGVKTEEYSATMQQAMGTCRLLKPLVQILSQP